MKRYVLAQYLVQVVLETEADEVPNALMDEALRTWEATAEYRGLAYKGDNRMNIERCLSGFVDGIDSLGVAGFKVEVLKDDEAL